MKYRKHRTTQVSAQAAGKTKLSDKNRRNVQDYFPERNKSILSYVSSMFLCFYAWDMYGLDHFTRETTQTGNPKENIGIRCANLR